MEGFSPCCTEIIKNFEHVFVFASALSFLALKMITVTRLSAVAEGYYPKSGILILFPANLFYTEAEKQK